MTQAYAVKKTLRVRLERWLRRKGQRRLADVIHHRPWWKWGPTLTALVGYDDCGNWSEPEPPTWYYRLGTPKRMFKTGYPIHPLRSIEVIKDYTTFRERTEGLNEDELYEWKAINANQDGELQLGKQYWGGNFYGLNKWETRLLVKYLRHWRRLDWYGVRSWLYLQGLNASVYHRKPFSCQVTPPPNTGGYSHWSCPLKKGHDGPHRYVNYIWWEESDRVQYVGDLENPNLKEL